MSEEKKEIITDEEEIMVNDNDSKDNSHVEEAVEKKELVIDESEEQNAKEEIKRSKKKRSNNNLKSFRDNKLNEESMRKQPVNKFLIALIVILIAGAGVAGFMALDYFNGFKSDKISKTMFEGTEVVELDGQTWILQDEVKVTAEVYTSADCEECNVEGLISLLKKEMPTLEIAEKSVEDDAIGVKYVPFVVFDSGIIKTDFYNFGNNKSLFTEENGKYVLNVAQLDLFPIKQIGKMTDDTGFTVGSEDAQISVIAITSFNCEECAVANPVLDKFEVEYKNKAKFTYKIYTDVEDEKLMNVSMAAFCADEQGKFDAYADNLFVRQAAWMAVEGDLTNVLGNYAATLGLDKVEFDECLTGKKYESQIKAMNKEIMDHGFTSVPVYFVDGERIDGVPTYEGMGAVLNKAISSSNFAN